VRLVPRNGLLPCLSVISVGSRVSLTLPVAGTKLP
jgi:hypothetical protein